MSTPKPSSHPASRPTPRSAGTGLTPAASSPPRSVASPAYHSHNPSSSSKANKSPYKHTQSAHHTPSGAANAHTPTPSGPIVGSSPAAAGGHDGPLHRSKLSNLGSRSAAASEAGTPALSGLGLGLGVTGPLDDAAILSELGLRARDAEDWNAQKIKEIADLLGERWGYVSQEGVERCLKKIGGLECLWEDAAGPQQQPDVVGASARPRTLSIAGNEVLIDVEWIGERVDKVVLSFPNSTETMESAKRGSEILRRDLVGNTEDGGFGYVPLKPLVENLRRLADIDQLGREKVSSFEALEGIFKSLERLWKFELEREEKETTSATLKPNGYGADLRVLCEKSGRPSTHSAGKIGLRVDYWLEKRLMPVSESRGEAESSTVHMDALERIRNRRRSLLITCQAFDAGQYPPIRISNAWLADELEATPTNEDGTKVEGISFIQWQEPQSTFVPPLNSGGSDAMQVDSIPPTLLPNVRFVAKLDPPITMPLKTAVEIFGHVGQPLLQESIENTTFASLLFPDKMIEAQTQAPRSAKDAVIRFDRTVRSFQPNGSSRSHDFRFRFFAQPDSWARTIHELPFSHPRQLVEILPFLRQWAFFCDLLRRSFGAGERSAPQTGPAQFSSVNGLPVQNGYSRKKKAPTKKPMSREALRSYVPPSDTESSSDDDGGGGGGSGRENRNRGLSMAAASSRQALSDHAKTKDHVPEDGLIDVYFVCPPVIQRIDLEISMSLSSSKEEATGDLSPPKGKSRRESSRFRILPGAKIEAEAEIEREDGDGDGDEDGGNGGVSGGGDKISPEGTHGRRLKPGASFAKRTARVLELGEDLGVLAAWIQSRGGSSRAEKSKDIGVDEDRMDEG